MNTVTVNFQMPERVELDEASYSNTFGRFILQPLERGFGVTLGNAFRRVLLSSLPGAAITAIKIENVLHEFSTIPGVVEDVSEIILNLKAVRMKLLNKKLGKVTVNIQGGKDFTAADIQRACPEIEILSPGQHIARLDPSANLEIELRIGRGRGYVPAEENKMPDQALGVIPIDSIFTPIKNVRSLVESIRVGQKTDYEKLILEITTDGSITPDDALTTASKILRDHIQLFMTFDVEQESEREALSQDTEGASIRKKLTMSVDDLELSVRSHNCLRAANIKTIADLVRREEAELLKFRNFGRKSLAELSEIIEDLGLTFGMDVDKYLKEGS
jgi:DNA-directed RNA polymerase subunit alpha